jgi:hypothetical protein
MAEQSIFDNLKGNSMSAPQTNLEKQERWHRAPLIGMAAGIIFVGLMFLWLTGVFSPIEKVEPPVAGVAAPSVAPAPVPPAPAGN